MLLLLITQMGVDASLSITHLFTTNYAVDEDNKIVFDDSHYLKRVHSVDTVVGDSSEKLKQDILQKIPKDSTKPMGLSSLVK